MLQLCARLDVTSEQLETGGRGESQPIVNEAAGWSVAAAFRAAATCQFRLSRRQQRRRLSKWQTSDRLLLDSLASAQGSHNIIFPVHKSHPTVV